jgi:hypothetical protein
MSFNWWGLFTILFIGIGCPLFMCLGGWLIEQHDKRKEDKLTLNRVEQFREMINSPYYVNKAIKRLTKKGKFLKDIL